jgi:hypothetical protein
MALTGLFAHLGNVAAHSANRFIGIVVPPVSGARGYTRLPPPRQVNYLPPPPPRSLPLPQGYPYQLGNREFYHGTDEEAALKVFYEKYWVFGNLQKPLAIWMTTQLGTAQGYSGNSGRILVLYIYPQIPLTEQGDEIYTFEVPLAEPNTEYDISGYVEPVALLDYHGYQIQ